MENKYQTTQVKTVKIFKTTVRNDKEAAKTAASLLTLYPVYKINFDLEDADNILRIEADQSEINTIGIIKHMADLGHSCEGIE